MPMHPYDTPAKAAIQNEIDRVAAVGHFPRQVLTGETYQQEGGALWYVLDNGDWVTQAYGPDQGAILPDETLTYTPDHHDETRTR